MTSATYLFPNSLAKYINNKSTYVEKVFAPLLEHRRRRRWGGWRWGWWWELESGVHEAILARPSYRVQRAHERQAEYWIVGFRLRDDSITHWKEPAICVTDRVGWGLDSFAKLRSCHGLAPALVFDGSRHDPDEWSRRVGKGLLKLASCRMRGPQSGGLWFGGKSAGFQAENSTWALKDAQRWPDIDFQRSQAPSDLGLLRFFPIPSPCLLAKTWVCYRKRVPRAATIKTRLRHLFDPGTACRY